VSQQLYRDSVADTIVSLMSVPKITELLRLGVPGWGGAGKILEHLMTLYLSTVSSFLFFV
jgi:hypothetical protein